MTVREKILKAQQQIQLLNERQNIYFENLLKDLNIDAESADAEWIFDGLFNGLDVDYIVEKLQTVDA